MSGTARLFSNSQQPHSYESFLNAHPRKKAVLASKVISKFQNGHGFTANSGATATVNDTSTYVFGSQCATFVSKGAGVQAGFQNYSIPSFSAVGKNFRIVLKIPDTTHITDLALYVGDTSLTNFWLYHLAVTTASNTQHISANEWMTITVNAGDFISKTGSPTLSAITAIKLAVYDDNTGNNVTVHVNSIETIPDGSAIFPTGVISICADDTYESFFTLAKPILDAAGFTATIFSISDLVGTANRATITDLYNAQEYCGWEIGGHAYSSANHNARLDTLSLAQVEDDFINQKSWAKDNGLKIRGMAYPGGVFNGDICRLVGKYYEYGRTIYSKIRETTRPGDYTRLRALSSISSYAGGVSAATLTTNTTGLIDVCKANCSWEIFVFHQIVASNVSATTEILTSDFQAIINKIVSAGVPVMNICDVIDSYS